ncbi:MAG: threonine--tRNA ligase [Labilithrix sp.]|nr:threonine--tRNA ligase [Labilithrix sp.]
MANRIPARELVKQKGQLAADVVAVKIDGRVVDLHTPVEEDAAFEVVRATDKEGVQVIRHSTAHVMADAVQRLFPGTKVTIGPAIEDGFYYDFDKPGGGFSEEDLATIEKAMLDIVANDTPFRREVVSRNEALALFEKMNESFKVEIIRSIPEDEEISLYKHGTAGKDEWVDVCEGPHVPSTGFLRAVKLTSVAGAYWRGDERNPMLQRIYGTAFPSKEALEEHLKLIEEAKQRDHRKLGKELDLFFFDPVAPAMPFLLPRGAYVYNRMVDYVRKLYVEYGYEEVITPQAFDPKLFRTSGHLGNYNENMYRLWTEDVLEEGQSVDAKDGKGAENPESADPAKKLAKHLQDHSFALKPMNCPSHCVIFGQRKRSYRELPWRVADFGRLHRYERGGVVHGLSRVRTFCQDDAHVFCTRDQVPQEIEKFIKLLYAVYKAFAFDRIDIKLATRPDKRIGSDADWDMSENALREGLERAGLPFEILPGEGAFYGPKVEFHVYDALKRGWQTGTIQYDPNLPERFELAYTGEDGKDHRPVMLHRAVFGSLERFFSVYLEHCGGNFPAWLAPTQAIVLTVSDKSEAYGRSVVEELRASGLRVEGDFSADKLGAKIRSARAFRHPYMLVVGPKDAEAGTVSVRSRDAGELGAMPRADFVAKLLAESASPR